MKKIFYIIFLFFLIFNVKVYAKYNIKYELECFEILVKKDKIPPEYKISYSERNWTNQDVLIKLKFSEPITGIDDFDYDNGFYIKTISENEKDSISVNDEAGNETIVNYEVNWIDKTLPEIKGIENNEIYTEKKIVEYYDNESGVKDVQKIFYGNLLIGIKKESNIKIKVYRSPKDIINYTFYRVEDGIESFVKTDKTEIEFNNLNFDGTQYYVVATDKDGNTFKSNIIYNTDPEINLDEEFPYEDNKTFSKKGFYDIKITDNAGNENYYTIQID